MDGSETSFEFDDEFEAVLRYRGERLDIASRGRSERQFDLLKDWIEANGAAYLDRLENRYRVYGEWLYACHRVFYDALPSYFLEFDVFDRERQVFLDTPSRRRLLAGLPALHSVRVVATGRGGDLSHPSRLDCVSAFKSSDWKDSAFDAARRSGLQPESFAGRMDLTDMGEGFYGKVEEDGVVAMRFKWVRPDFVAEIVNNGRHWKDMPIVPNRLASATLRY